MFVNISKIIPENLPSPIVTENGIVIKNGNVFSISVDIKSNNCNKYWQLLD